MSLIACYACHLHHQHQSDYLDLLHIDCCDVGGDSVDSDGCRLANDAGDGGGDCCCCDGDGVGDGCARFRRDCVLGGLYWRRRLRSSRLRWRRPL